MNAPRIVEETVATLKNYGTIPIAFRVTSRFLANADESRLSDLCLVEEPVVPYTKDYDALSDEGPSSWMTRWDISNWGILAAYQDEPTGERRVGGAVIAWKTQGVDLLGGRDDLAVLWDLRVHPDYRRQGVGARLFAAAEDWSRQRRCRRLMVETQNINVAACRFYERQGCHLGEVNPFAYSGLPDELQLLWYKEL